MRILITVGLMLLTLNGLSQIKADIQKVKSGIDSLKNSKFSISGDIGVSYEGYGLMVDPSSPFFYGSRRPWNLVRFQFQPTISYGSWKIPFNFSFSPMQNNFGSPPYGFASLPGFPRRNFGQWLTNPVNNFGINPAYKWAELQLGTQYLKYSELSTGDIGVFGAGFSLKPGKYRIKFFHGISQQAFQPFIASSPSSAVFPGVYKRSITMGQLGLEKEGSYFIGFNLVKGHDISSSIPSPISIPVATPNPTENFIISFVSNVKTQKGWFLNTELATTFQTKNTLLGGPSSNKSFPPFINSNASTARDHAVKLGLGKRTSKWELGLAMKYLGAGYSSMGWPLTQNDRLDYTVNTRFNAFKNKVNVTASIGQRFSNWSGLLPGGKIKQLIANVNLFAQVNDHLSVNTSYNNFGFNAPSLSGGTKNVGNDLSVNPTYTWTNSKMSNLLSLTYSWSKYKEKIYIPYSVTDNNTHTALLLYVPTIFSKPDLSMDFSALYFYNTTSVPTHFRIWTLSASMGKQFSKIKTNLKGQLQYNNTRLLSFTPSNNILFSINADVKLNKRTSWASSATINLFRYGNELAAVPALLGAGYFESTYRTAIKYHFGK